MSDQEPYSNAAADANGVVLSSGEYVLSVTDLEIPWPGFPFRFTRTYRSRVSKITPMGAAWSHNYLERITSADSICAGITWFRGDLWGGQFTYDSVTNRWNGPAGSHL